MRGQIFHEEESSSTDGDVTAPLITKKIRTICSAASTAATSGRAAPAKGLGLDSYIYPSSSFWRNCFNEEWQESLNIWMLFLQQQSPRSLPQRHLLMLVLRARPDDIQHAAMIFLEMNVTMECHQGLLQSYRAQYDHVLSLSCGYHQATRAGSSPCPSSMKLSC